jgi:hypothetical protein
MREDQRLSQQGRTSNHGGTLVRPALLWFDPKGPNQSAVRPDADIVNDGEVASDD